MSVVDVHGTKFFFTSRNIILVMRDIVERISPDEVFLRPMEVRSQAAGRQFSHPLMGDMCNKKWKQWLHKYSGGGPEPEAILFWGILIYRLVVAVCVS